MYHHSVKKKSRNRLVGFPTKAKRELLRALTYPLPLPSPAVSFNNWNQNSGALVRILKARGGWGEWLMTQIWCVQIKKCKKKKARRLKNTKIDLPLSGWGQKLTVTCEPSLRFNCVTVSPAKHFNASRPPKKGAAKGGILHFRQILSIG